MPQPPGNLLQCSSAELELAPFLPFLQMMKAAPEVGVALRLQRNLIGFLSTWRVRWPRESAWPCGYSAI